MSSPANIHLFKIPSQFQYEICRKVSLNYKECHAGSLGNPIETRLESFEKIKYFNTFVQTIIYLTSKTYNE